MSLVEQRNRFLSFAFAAADILVETDLDGRTLYSAGATGALGDPRPDQVGDPLEARLDRTSRPLFSALKRGLRPGRRVGPSRVTIGGREARLSGWRLGEDETIRWAISFEAVDAPEELEPEAFASSGNEALQQARDAGESMVMTVMKVDGLEEIDHRLGGERAARVETALTAITQDAVGGGVSRKVNGGRYALIHDEGVDLNALKESVLELVNANGISPVEVSFQSIEDAPEIVPDVAVEAFLYAVNEAAESPEGLNITSLREAAQSLAKETERKMNALKMTISGRVIEPYAQPIQDLNTNELSHYELLARLPGGKSLSQEVGFAERTGLIYELDFNMAELAINFLSAQGDRPALAVNISGKSLSNPAFGSRLMKMLADAKIDRSRLMFELTETAGVNDVQTANAVLQKIRKRGHKICLDDFGAGAAGFHYLRDFETDYVKIDGRYIQAANRRDRDSVILRSIIKLSADLGCKTIAEMVESEDQAVALRALGADFAQGYLFGKPAPLKDLADAQPRRVA
jgi:EAL domain-containing protein (putative c-di-GMP-specific phosphodiesterase class I)